MLRPTYIIEVANISHIAGINKMNGLKLRDPLVKVLLSTEPSCIIIIWIRLEIKNRKNS